MPIYATAGAKLYIGPAKAALSRNLTSADFTGIASGDWVEIGFTETLGTLGDTSQEVTFDAIGNNRRLKLKGTKDAGTLNVVCAIDYTDPGQIAVLAAEATPNDYAFKIEYNDAPSTGASPKPSTRQFVAKVMSAAEALDGANNVMKLNMTLGVNSNIVRTNASAS